MQTLKSEIDQSVNFVENHLVGFIESRYVRRSAEYFIAYLSSQTGCNRGCRMCHLTATRQTQFTNCDVADFVSQLESVFSHYREHLRNNGAALSSPARYMHINWMARGEPLANPTITDNSTELFYRLGSIAQNNGLPVKLNISTIMPTTMRKSLVDMFPVIQPTIYYSIYSVKNDFRNKWLPGAMDVNTALSLLAEYQRFSKKIVKFHCAFIHGENDSRSDISDMMKLIAKHKITGEFNIVRYNPFSAEQGLEAYWVDEIADFISSKMPCKIIPRVGSDVHASCGTFFGKTAP